MPSLRPIEPAVAPRARPSRFGLVWRCSPMVGAALLVGFLELKSQPSLHDLPHLPRGVVEFCDRHDFLNNVTGFGGFAATVHLAFAGWRREPARRVAGRAAALGAVVVVLELIQLALPARSCDWRDVAAGWLGIGLASLPWLRGARPDFFHAG